MISANTSHSLPVRCALCLSKSNYARRGLILVLSSPSGTGKSTICQSLLNSRSDLTLSISVTTRAPRPSEVNGRDYYFVTIKEFEELVSNNKLLEKALVFDNHYGIPRSPVEQAVKGGRDILLTIDWQGYRKLRMDVFPEDVVGVFVLPPSLMELKDRLYRRGQDSNEVILNRISHITSEISHWHEYPYVIVNRDLHYSVSVLESILETERLKKYRQSYIPATVDHLNDHLSRNGK